MKRIGLISGLRMLMRVALHYSEQHSMSLSAMHGHYTKHWSDPQQMRYILSITPYGSLYQVSQILYKNEKILKEETCLASYGWHSNGHLIEIGGYRYWIFNPLKNELYVKSCSDDGTKTIEIYSKN